MAAPWYQRDGAAFIQGTMGLTLEEKGAYSLCLDLVYSNGGPIADDSRWLAGVCGVSIRKWTALRTSLIQRGKLYVTPNGLLMNERAGHQIAELHRSKRIEKSAKGGRDVTETSAKPSREHFENGATYNENKDLLGGDKNRIDEIREDKEEESSLRSEPPPGQSLVPSKPAKPPKPKEHPRFAEFYDAYPLKKSRGAAVKAFQAAVAKADPKTLIAGARRYAVARQHEDPNFTKHPATWLNQECWLDQEVPHATTRSRFAGPTSDRIVQPASSAISEAVRERGGGSLFDIGGPEIIDITPARHSEGDPGEEAFPRRAAHTR